VPAFKLRFPASRIRYWAARFRADEDDAVLRTGAAARRRGYLTRGEFLTLGEWKTPRSRPLRLKNSEKTVRAATRAAFATTDGALKVEALLRLRGVGLPTASVILHLCDRDPYPIFDVRALWSAGLTARARTSIGIWLRYTEFARILVRGSGCSVREVDRALWQYSKERQPNTPLPRSEVSR